MGWPIIIFACVYARAGDSASAAHISNRRDLEPQARIGRNDGVAPVELRRSSETHDHDHGEALLLADLCAIGDPGSSFGGRHGEVLCEVPGCPSHTCRRTDADQYLHLNALCKPRSRTTK